MDNERHFENELLGVSFALPEKMTVRQQVRIRDRVWARDNDEPAAFKFWFSMVDMIEEWDCEEYPKPDDIDVDTVTDPTATEIIMWVSNQMAGYFMDKGFVPKEI